MFFKVSCGGCHMLVLAAPRPQGYEEVTVQQDITENYLEKSYSELLGNPSTPSTLNRTLSARVRRRERERSPDQFGRMLRTLPALAPGFLNSSLPVTSRSIPARLPSMDIPASMEANGIHRPQESREQRSDSDREKQTGSLYQDSDAGPGNDTAAGEASEDEESQAAAEEEENSIEGESENEEVVNKSKTEGTDVEHTSKEEKDLKNEKTEEDQSNEAEDQEVGEEENEDQQQLEETEEENGEKESDAEGSLEEESHLEESWGEGEESDAAGEEEEAGESRAERESVEEEEEEEGRECVCLKMTLYLTLQNLQHKSEEESEEEENYDDDEEDEEEDDDDDEEETTVQEMTKGEPQAKNSDVISEEQHGKEPEIVKDDSVPDGVQKEMLTAIFNSVSEEQESPKAQDPSPAEEVREEEAKEESKSKGLFGTNGRISLFKRWSIPEDKKPEKKGEVKPVSTLQEDKPKDNRNGSSRNLENKDLNQNNAGENTTEPTQCEFFCSPGYQLKGERSVTCMSSKAWTGKHTSCVDVEPPTIKCPSVKEKTAEPETLTARVYWETPEGRDTADGILTDVTLKGMPPGSYFPEGDHRIQYTVFDRAGNKGTCKFAVKVRVRRCGRLHPPENGYMKCSSDGDNYGATCAFACMGGFELQGSTARVCQYGLTWAGSEPSCAPMNINVAVRSAAALLDQFYEKRRLLLVSAPSAANHNYRFQMGILQQAQCGVDMRHITIIELVGVYPAQIGRIRHRLIPPGLALQLRLLLQISHTSYTMVLIDKHGMDKERYAFPVTAAELFTLIDTFPLRKEEMKVQAEAGQTCN
ncbi:UNVERIFIED_CONTAM: hypothetical protein FKN15_060112 [Acipenser sinensis]